MVQSQGTGRPRRIALSEERHPAGLRIHILLYEEMVRQALHILQLQRELKEAGHTVAVVRRTLTEMGLNMEKASTPAFTSEAT